MSNNHSTHGTVIRITSAKADVGVYQARIYKRGVGGILIGEFDSSVKAEHAFFRKFPLGILAEGERHGVQQMPTRGHAREYAKNFPEWKAVDTGNVDARWQAVKRAK